MSWSRFKTYFHHNADLGVSLDISRMPFPDDFFSSMEPQIQQAFEPYYTDAYLETATDPNLVHDLAAKLDTAAIYTQDEIDRCAARDGLEAECAGAGEVQTGESRTGCGRGIAALSYGAVN